jgi:hypothetical protein
MYEMKGQTSMIAIVIAIVMLVFIMLFMFTSLLGAQAGQSVRSEYRNLYAHSILLSLLRTDTECGTYSEVLKGAYFGGGKCDSLDFLAARLPARIAAILNGTGHTDYEWFLEASPKNFRGNMMAFGNPVVKESMDRWDARTVITWEGYQLEVKIYIRVKQ